MTSSFPITRSKVQPTRPAVTAATFAFAAYAVHAPSSSAVAFYMVFALFTIRVVDPMLDAVGAQLRRRVMHYLEIGSTHES